MKTLLALLLIQPPAPPTGLIISTSAFEIQVPQINADGSITSSWQYVYSIVNGQILWQIPTINGFACDPNCETLP